MTWNYEPGSVRWKRWTSDRDVRLHRPPNGWEAQALVIDTHPITDKVLPRAQWWIRETYVGDRT